MVIVECVALGTMISNDLVMLLLPTSRKLFHEQSGDLGSQILTIRRIGIVVILLLGLVYFQSTSDAALASIGLVSFAAIAQIAPSFFGGLFWRRGSALERQPVCSPEHSFGFIRLFFPILLIRPCSELRIFCVMGPLDLLF